MKISIGQDEWYPVYTFESYDKGIEVSDETIKKWEKAFKEFEDVQCELEEIYKRENNHE